MDIRLEKGSMEYLDACERAISDSTLGEKYFSAPESARNAVLEGLEQENLYVGLYGGECVGFFFYLPKGAFHSSPYLHIIAVRKEYRGMGVGKALMDALEEMVFRTDRKIFLVVADFNPDGKRFYERNGYRQVGEIPGLYRPGITEYLMMKERP